MTLEHDLVNFGLAPKEAFELNQAFGAEPDFMAGLDQVAASVEGGQLPIGSPPAGEPWRTFFTEISKNGQPPAQAYQAAMRQMPVALQAAIEAAVSCWVAANQKRKATAASRKHRRYNINEYLLTLNRLGYTFRMNDMNDVIDVSGTPITNEMASEIRARMRQEGFEFVNVMEDIYIMEANHHRYNPILDYLNALQYDGGAHISELAAHFSDRYGVFQTWLRRWLIGCIAKAKDGHQNMVFVLDGPQGIGKSLFSKWLCSGIGKQMFCEQSINLDDKDTYIRLCSHFIWEIAEFGQTIRRVDRELFKNFVTQSTVTVRRPFGKYDMVKPARASLIGTVNDEVGILDDPTGSRRFMVTHLESIDWSYSKLDVNQVWAEAQSAYLAGEVWQLTGIERDKSQMINSQYEVEDPTEGLLLRYFRVDPTIPGWTSSQEILEKLENNGLKGTTKSNSMALATVMKRLKCERKKQKNIHGQLVWGYCGVSII